MNTVYIGMLVGVCLVIPVFLLETYHKKPPPSLTHEECEILRSLYALAESNNRLLSREAPEKVVTLPPRTVCLSK